MNLGVGFELLGKLRGTVASPDEFLRDVETWVCEYAADLAPSTWIGFSEEHPTLFCSLHPAAEEFYLFLLDPDHLVASAKTSTVGPGYHIFLCDMVKRLGEKFSVNWITDNEEYFDEANYFFSGNPETVFAEMTTWLKALCQGFFNGLSERKPGDMPTQLCLSIGEVFEADAVAVTPLGPRDWEWLKKVAADGSEGRDFFAWWKPGLHAEYFLGRALSLMWTEVRWRKPVNEAERQVLKYVADYLETAFKLDPNLAYPWAEWNEILELLDRDGGDLELEFVRSHQRGVSTIGYRRRDVAVTLPGYWVLKVPGSFSDFEADQEGDFSSQDPPRVIWFTSYRFDNNPMKLFEEAYQEILNRGPGLVEERNGYIGRAEINEKKGEDKKYFVLTSSNLCRKGRAILSIVFSNLEDQIWAESVWRSLQPPHSCE